MPSPDPASTLPMVVTIDGPAGAGKSTVAKAMADRLNISYLDTGAMYRSLTLKALRSKLNLEDEQALVDLARATSIDLKGNPRSGLKVFLDGEDVSAEIRTLEVTNNTFYIARAARVREVLVGWQRQIGRSQSVVVEGRDVGTVVFPNATHKFYLDADPQERADRRIRELEAKGQTIDHGRLKAELLERDKRDMTRSASPLRKAEDAVLIDSTALSVDQVVEKMLNVIRNKRT